MKNNVGISRWFLRTWNFFIKPQQEWKTVNPSNNNFTGLMRFYFIPIVVISTLPYLVVETFNLGLSKAIARTIIHILAMLIGARIAKRITFNQLNKATNYHGIAMQISIYSSTIFSVFYSISVAFDNGFFADLFILCSFFAARTVYTGIRQYISSTKPTLNLTLIPAICIIFCPILLSRLLKIIFHIPVINL